MKPKNTVSLKVTRKNGSLETRHVNNDLTLYGARRNGLFDKGGTADWVGRSPALYSGLHPGPVTYKDYWSSYEASVLVSNEREFIEYLPVITTNGKRYQPSVHRYMITVPPASQQTYSFVVFGDSVSTSNGMRYLRSFAQLDQAITVNPEDTVEITYTTFWEVYGDYDGTEASGEHIYRVINTGSVDIELFDIDGNPVSSTPVGFTLYTVLTAYANSNTPEQNMNRASLHRMSTSAYVDMYYAPDLDTGFKAFRSDSPRVGTTYTEPTNLTPADSAEDVLPATDYNYFGFDIVWSAEIPAGGDAPVSIQAILNNAINGSPNTPSWSVNERLNADLYNTTTIRAQGTLFVLDSPVTIPVENSAVISGSMKVTWEPPQGFLDEFPTWVRPNS